MTDTVIKGSGNSRSIKTVPNALTMYPTHEAMIAAMVDGTFPIDLGPLNDAGLLTRGMDLNKANLLKDETAALYGKGDNSSPDDIFAAIRPLIQTAQNTANGKAKIAFGSYTGRFSGTQTGGPSKAVSLSLPFTPAVVIMIGTRNPDSRYDFIAGYKNANWIMYTGFLSGNYASGVGFGYNSNSMSYGAISGNTILWYTITGNGSLYPGDQFDQSGYTYYYVAIG